MAAAEVPNEEDAGPQDIGAWAAEATEATEAAHVIAITVFVFVVGAVGVWSCALSPPLDGEIAIVRAAVRDHDADSD